MSDETTLDDLWPICGICGEKASSIEALVGGGYQVSCSNCDNEAQGDTAEDAADNFGESGPGCPDCAGTGIGRYGDPDTSRCPTCKGGGILRLPMPNTEHWHNAPFAKCMMCGETTTMRGYGDRYVCRDCDKENTEPDAVGECPRCGTPNSVRDWIVSGKLPPLLDLIGWTIVCSRCYSALKVAEVTPGWPGQVTWNRYGTEVHMATKAKVVFHAKR